MLSGSQAIQVGSVLATSVGPNSPEGFLGKVVSVTPRADQTVVNTVPTTLQSAVPEGSFKLSKAMRVGPNGVAGLPGRGGLAATSASAWPGRRPLAHAVGDGGSFDQALSEALSCGAGATFSVTGSVGLSATPDLRISWTKSGITVLFIETMTASASLSGTVSGSASCTLTRTAVLAEPAPLGTFTVEVLGVPVVVTLEGQIYLDGEAETQGSVSAGISGELSASGGLAYAGGRVRVISPEVSLNLSRQGPNVQANASLGAHVTPVLEVLLYGVGGPVFEARTGLDLKANTTQDPWWTLTAPLNVTAALTVPLLKISTPTLALYGQTFTIATAGGPF